MSYRILGVTAVLVWLTAGFQGQAYAQQTQGVDQPGETSTTFQVLTQMAGDGDGRLAGVTAAGDIHLWNGKEWKRLEGQLHQVLINRLDFLARPRDEPEVNSGTRGRRHAPSA